MRRNLLLIINRMHTFSDDIRKCINILAENKEQNETDLVFRKNVFKAEHDVNTLSLKIYFAFINLLFCISVKTRQFLKRYLVYSS